MPSRVDIGLSVGQRAIRAVGVRRGRVLWAFEGELDAGESLAAAIEKLLSLAPLGRWPRPSLTAAVGPSRAQVKQLGQLPPVRDLRALSALVQEGASRFFLRNGVPLVTSTPVPTKDGAYWVAAFDRPVIEAVGEACRAARVRFRGAIPSVVVLGRVFDRESVSWRDGDAVSEISYRDGAIVGLRRRWRDLSVSHPVETAVNGSAPERDVGEHVEPNLKEVLHGPLMELGPGAARFADAYGAAIAAPGATLSFRPRDGTRAVPPVLRWRLAMAGVAFVAASIASLAAPVVRDALVARAAAARLAELGEARPASARLERELAQVTSALGAVAAFEAGQYSPLTILEAFTDSLPGGAALVTLRLDSLDGSAVVLGTQLAGAVSALDRARLLTGVEIVGPLTREALGGRELERASVRFSLVRNDAPVPARVTVAGGVSP